MANPTVAILGRPNVGKSTLFNRLIGKRRAIVEETAGVTRDRIYGLVDWNGRQFHLIDTGGFMATSAGTIEETVLRQAELARDEAGIIILIVDSQAGAMPDDLELARRLRQLGKPLLLAVNKVDDLVHEVRAGDFYELGLGTPHPISAASGRGVGDLLDAILSHFPPATKPSKEESEAIGLAIIGVPNAGKSSFLNAILKEEKAIVTDIPGTTRDAVDSYLQYQGQTLRLIDTAGLRRKAKVSGDIEYYSTVRTFRALEECHVALVMIDAERGFHLQDRQIIALVEERGKGLVVVVNKWDLIAKDGDTMGQWVKKMRKEFKPMEHIPLVFTSVHHNRRLWKAVAMAVEVSKERDRQIPTAELNRFVEGAVRYLPPPAVQGKRITIKYATQVHRRPPLFAFFCNHPKLVPVSYRRYIENRLRESFGFEGVPVGISFRQK